MEKEEEGTWLENRYVCPRCGHEWNDEWDCECEDECPECRERGIAPVESVPIPEEPQP